MTPETTAEVLDLLEWLSRKAIYNYDYQEHVCAACGHIQWDLSGEPPRGWANHDRDCRLQNMIDRLKEEGDHEPGPRKED